jgi:nicotinamide phosphoribosyltransferase
MEKNQFSADNIAFGQGGALLQQVNRDTLKFAMKCSAIQVNGEWKEVFKNPSTATWKTSKKGRLALIEENGQYKTIPERPWQHNILKPVYNNGIVEHNLTNLRMIRSRVVI